MKREVFSIRTLFSAAMAAMMVTFVLIIGSLLSTFFAHSMQEAALSSTEEIITQVNSNLDFYISDIIGVSDYARNLARTTSNLAADDIRLRLEALIDSRDDLIRIAAFDMDGRTIVSTESERLWKPEDVVMEQWFRRARDGEGDFFFTGPHTQSLSPSEDLVISYSTVINYGDINRKTSPAVLLIDLNFNAVSNLSENVNLSSSGYIYIISNDGNIVFHPRMGEIGKGTFSEDLESVEEHVYGTYISEFAGRKRLTIIQTVSQTRWRIVGVAFMDELLHPLFFFRLTLVFLMITSIIVATFVSRGISNRLTRPLRILEAEMRDIKEGVSTTIPIPKSISKEVLSLYRSFNSMLSRIQELVAKVKNTEAVKRQRELDALQAKINPHFLYNTLDSVVWMAERGNNQGVVKMVTALASLFRISIAKGHDTITLKEELSHVRSYLEIQSMRYKDKFHFVIELPEDLENCPTIKLIVQPIVENSIYHGIKYLQDEGLISISVMENDGKTIAISVKDNGVGMSADVAASLLDKNSSHQHLSDGNGIGLQNIDERIKLSYGDEYGLTIHSELDEGTEVIITIPKLNPITPVVIKR